MNIFVRFFLLVFICLWVAGSALGQNQAQNSDGGAAAVLSDQSGSLVTQSDVVFFQSDEAQVRMNDVATALMESLQRGVIGNEVIVPTSVTNLLTAGSEDAAEVHAQLFINALVQQGLREKQARSLAQSAASLLGDGTVHSEQFVKAVQAYNAAVEAAPHRFLAQPPTEFVVVRTVLMNLIQGAAD